MSLDSFIDRIWSNFSYDLAIDLGTANTKVYIKGKGIVIREPSAVAQHKRTKAILAIGNEAKKMVGKTPANILAIRPLRDGVISDFDVAEAMLRYYIRKVHESRLIFPPKISRPRVVIGIPSGVTEVERKAVLDAATRGGARKVYLIEEPMAAAIGAGLPVEEARGSMIADIGGGTTEIAVISLGGIVANRSIRIAGDEMDEEIVGWAKGKHNLLIGERTAEELKIAIGSAWGKNEKQGEPKASLRGRCLTSGLPKEVEVTQSEVREALQKPLREIVLNVKEVIEEVPPELLSDIYHDGIVLTGGSSLLADIDKLIAEETKVPVRIADDPLTTVVRGCGKTLEEIELLEKVKVVWGV